jgi:two-component system, chemotaxis family, response regulator WspR
MHELKPSLAGNDLLAGHCAIMVLLVDDQPLIGEAVRRALASDSDISFHYCSDPLLALQTAERIRPTVILQDLVMPGVDGLALVCQYRGAPATQNIPIIVLSTKEEAAIKSAAFAKGANDYLVKLPDHIELIARIRYHSQAYLHLLQRDAAYRALHASQQELVEKNFELSRLINVDGLTGLNNRRYFDEFADIEWKRAIREHAHFALLMIDVDDFKRYNDTYGHLAGDDVLRNVGRTIRSAAQRPGDIAARYGGEEFVVILPASSVEGTESFGEKLCRGVENLRIQHSGSTVAGVLTVSVGGASTSPRPGDSLLTLIEAADVALYRAKRSGRNRIVTRDMGRPEEYRQPRNVIL